MNIIEKWIEQIGKGMVCPDCGTKFTRGPKDNPYIRCNGESSVIFYHNQCRFIVFLKGKTFEFVVYDFSTFVEMYETDGPIGTADRKDVDLDIGNPQEMTFERFIEVCISMKGSLIFL